MPKNVKFSDKKPLIAIGGHVGVGHVYGPGGMMQEDSCGMGMMSRLMADQLGLDLTVTGVDFVDFNTQVTVHTAAGGKGTACFKEGYTFWEVELVKERAVGRQPYAPQSLTQRVLGRISGQGTHKAASVLCEAFSKAVMDSFAVSFPDKFIYMDDDQPGTTGGFIGAVLNLNGVPTACVLTVNSSEDGTGPNEDAEGNVAIGSRRVFMEKLGMINIPTILLEGKQYIDNICSRLDKTHFVVRWNSEYDNKVVADCLTEAAHELGAPVVNVPDAYPRYSGQLLEAGRRIAGRLREIADAFESATAAGDKVGLADELARLARYDMGGAIFMSNHIHDVTGSGGMMPGVAAMFSLGVSKAYVREWKLAYLEPDELNMAVKIVLSAHKKLATRLQEANAIVESRCVPLAILQK